MLQVSNLKAELEELQELHDFVEADHLYREESLLAKIDDDPPGVSAASPAHVSLIAFINAAFVLTLGVSYVMWL